MPALRYLRQLTSLKWLNGRCRYDLAIADNGFEYVVECIPPERSVLHVPMRGECWFVNIRIVYWFLMFLKQRRRYGLALRGCYVAAVCRSVGARAVLTMIDNNNWDTGLVEAADLRVICIGNGFRRPEHIRNKAFDCYFALNDLPNVPGLPFQFSAREYYAVGHIKMGIYQSMKLQRQSNGCMEPASKQCAVWVSQYRLHMHVSVNGDADAAVRDQIDAEFAGSGYLARYATEHGLCPRIAHAAERKGRGELHEIRFFDEATSGRGVIESYQGDQWGAYKLVDDAEFVVGMYSTLLFEALSVGRRVVFFLPDEFNGLIADLAKCMPLRRLDPLRVRTNDYHEFERKCDEIRTLPEAEYFELVTDLRTDIASFDHNYLPQNRIRNYIETLFHCQRAYESVTA